MRRHLESVGFALAVQLAVWAGRVFVDARRVGQQIWRTGLWR